MRVYCTLCQHEIKGEKESQILERSMLHFKERHPSEGIGLAQQLKTAHELMATYLLLKQYVDIPNDERELLASYDTNETHLAAIFGFEPEGSGEAGPESEAPA